MRVVEGEVEIEDVGAFVERVDGIGREHGAAIQAFDARYVAGRDHLAAAVDRANRAFARDGAIADDRAVEILCYAAGRRQIQRALEMGVSEGENPVAVVIDGGDEESAVDAIEGLMDPGAVLDSARDPDLIREFFGISDAEVEATEATLSDLVIERVALLVVEK